MMPAPIRVVLAEDHTLFRAGIRTLLQDMPGFEVVAEAADGREALRVIAEKQPDVALVDITMPGLNGLEVLARLVRDCPSVRVIILSMHAHEEYVRQALQSGAAGYLLKDADVTELEVAIRAVLRGESYLSPAVSQRVIEWVRRGEPQTSSLDQLTSRQREILQLIAEGHSTKSIATLLNLSTKTVDAHRTELMTRLGIHDVAGIVRYAIRMGLVSPEK
jgi:DNA-binding NarL/FixJ family response regulator